MLKSYGDDRWTSLSSALVILWTHQQNYFPLCSLVSFLYTRQSYTFRDYNSVDESLLRIKGHEIFTIEIIAVSLSTTTFIRFTKDPGGRGLIYVGAFSRSLIALFRNIISASGAARPGSLMAELTKFLGEVDRNHPRDV